MANLPEEVISQILVKTPLKSIGRFRCVCKSWDNLLTDSWFLNLHNLIFKHILVGIGGSASCLSFYLKESGVFVKVMEKVKVPVQLTSNFDTKSSPHCLGSCNGLILSLLNNELYLWNPIIGDCIELPKVGFDFCGLGYDSCNDDFKVVIISFIDGLSVYSLKSRAWKKIRRFQKNTRFRLFSGKKMGVSVNGVLHWLLFGKRGGKRIILSFDMATEKFGMVQEPVEINGDKNFILDQLCVFEGFLCLVCSYRKQVWGVWVMKDYGVNESWTKLVEIRCQYSVCPLCFNENGELILQRDGRELMKYDPRSREFKKFFYVEWRTIPIMYSENLTSILSTPKTTDHHGTETQQSNTGD